MNLTTGKELKEWRKRYRITQKELAEKTGYSVFRISHLENGNEQLSSRMKKAIINLDRQINDNVITSWRELLKWNTEGGGYFKKELLPIEDRLGYILRSAPRKGFELPRDYLDLFSSFLQIFIATTSPAPCNTDNHLNKLRKKILKYRSEHL